MSELKGTLNTNLHQARNSKKDEFYTQRTDIEKELKHYRDHFKGKVVYCNCDDPSVSGFFHYFSHNFELLNLKKLITTCYKNPNMEIFSPHDSEEAVYLEYEGDKNGNRVPDIEEIGRKPLKSDGDFRNPECIELLKQADIVVTNPPFSLFREYVAQIIEHDKKFIILGPQNAITYKETFKLLKENKMWLGHDNNGTKWFLVNDDYDIATESRKKMENGQKYFSMGSIVWFTNINISKRYEDFKLYRRYYGSESDYPKYDSYDVINVDKIKDIPMDYEGVMGVPITFVNKHNPEQFEILGIANSARWIGYECLTKINGKNIYNRILIKNKRLHK